MKKIFMWVNYYIEDGHVGTTKKIRAEIETLREMGYIVFYTAYLSNGVAIYDNDDKQIAFKEVHSRSSKIKKFLLRKYLIKLSINFISSNVFEYYWLRINLIDHLYKKMLKTMKLQKSIVLLETLSYFPNMRKKSLKELGYFIIYNSIHFNRHFLKKNVDLVLTEGVINDFYGINTVEFGMGVVTSQYNIHKYEGNLDNLNLIMVGCKSFYHGTDRIIRSIYNYYKETQNDDEIHLHLVGTVLNDDKKLIKDLDLDKYVHLYGPHSGHSLDNIYNKANIALGPLAQFRASKKDTGLKTKEYFARAIPYIYTGKEDKVPNNYPFILEVPNNEMVINLKDVIEFYESIKFNKDLTNSMRSFADENFSWNQILDKVFQEVKKLSK